MIMMKIAKIPRDRVNRITLRVHDSGTESVGVCRGGPPTTAEEQPCDQRSAT
jgi:hypothetical protein